jgi:hypothetical protein
MKKKRIIAVAVFALLLLLSSAWYRGQTPRELILKRDGVPLAGLKADVLLRGANDFIQSSTDFDGRLDLRSLPEGSQTIRLWMFDGTDSVFNGNIEVPAQGSRTIDFQGNRIICTTVRTYMDFIFFQCTGRDVLEIEDNNSTIISSKREAEPPPSRDRTQPTASPLSAPGN